MDGKGISRHGFALNVNPEMENWDSIIPCGLDEVQMACVADFVNPPEMAEVARLAADELGDVLGYSMEWIKR